MGAEHQSVSTFEVNDHVARITLNRPEAMNSLNPELRWELSQHWDEVEANDDIWLAVVTGAGERAFCAGTDLKHRARERDADEAQRAHWRKLAAETTSLIERWHFPKPIIARVNGFALGGGLEQALACDIIVAAEHAEFGLPEPRRGLIAGAAGVHRLPRQIGLKPAMGYMLTGRHIPAARAYELGLVNQVVPRDRLDEAVAEFVRNRGGRVAVPAMLRLRRHFEEMRRRVLAEAPDDAEKATRLLVDRILRAPSETMREIATKPQYERPDAPGGVSWSTVEGALVRLFRLEDSDTPSDRDGRAEDEENRKEGSA